MASDLTPAQHELLGCAFEIEEQNEAITCFSLYSIFRERGKRKTKPSISSLLQALGNKGFVKIVSRRALRGRSAVSIFVITDKGKEAFNAFEVGRANFGGKKPRTLRKRCDKCSNLKLTYYYKKQYLCKNCLNPDIPIERVSPLQSNAIGWGRFG